MYAAQFVCVLWPLLELCAAVVPTAGSAVCYLSLGSSVPFLSWQHPSTAADGLNKQMECVLHVRTPLTADKAAYMHAHNLINVGTSCSNNTYCTAGGDASLDTTI